MSKSAFEMVNDTAQDYEAVFSSWQHTVDIHKSSLRPPQQSALYACFSYESSHSFDPVIICMPTGTGKTGVIGSLIFRGDAKRTLIVVPTDALRTQIANDVHGIEKYKKWQLVGSSAMKPNVFKMIGGIDSEDDLEKIRSAHIVVATAQSLIATDIHFLSKFHEIFERIIFDEAHHVEANGWDAIRELAKKFNLKIHQFTATPYRLDGKKIDGKMVFRYPLSEAYKDRYFAKIEFIPVEEYYEEKSDLAIAKKAIEVLEKDLKSNYKHILMARADSIKQAKKLKKLYEEITTLRVEAIHSGIKNDEKNKILSDLKSGAVPIVVCVDMLGEGYDLPNLKICALHGHKKSMPVFFQLIGRFTRVADGLQNAKIIANTQDDQIISMFDDLFQIDSDWNSILHGLNESKVESEFSGVRIAENVNNKDLKSIIERNDLTIKCSSQVYECDKSLETIVKDTGFKKMLQEDFDDHILEILKDENLAILLTKTKNRVFWSSESDFTDIYWNVFLFYVKDKSLFIHGADKNIVNHISTRLGFEKIKGNNIFRIFADLDLAVYANIGVLNQNSNANFVMYTGKDVLKAISEVERSNMYPSNMFGHGYTNGIKTSIGCSRKGIFWSMKSVKITEWVRWCGDCIRKIQDESIDNRTFVNGMMKYSDVSSLDGIEIVDITPYKLHKQQPENIKIIITRRTKDSQYRVRIDSYDIIFKNYINGQVNFFVSLLLSGYSNEFIIECSWSFEGGFKIIDKNSLNYFDVNFTENPTHFLKELDLSLWTTDFSFIIINEKTKFSPNLEFKLDESKIITVDWSNTQKNVESWNYGKEQNSVQGKIIEIIKSKDKKPEILFFDDGAHELADLIEFHLDDALNTMQITLYHCKYAKEKDGGSTIGSITELVQQSISSVSKLGSLAKSLETLKSRENKASTDGKTRFVDGMGDMSTLSAVIKKLRKYEVSLRVCMVQPSLSKSELNQRVRTNLASVSSILKKTVNAETFFYISE